MDAFSLLAAPLAAQSGGHDPARLIGFFAQEMQLFFQHIQSAVVTYSNTGELPGSLFTQKAVKSLEKQAEAGGKKREKSKRKPTAFNWFVKEKMEELKARGDKDPEGGTKANNAMFQRAVGMWKELSEEERKAYTAKVAPIINATAEGGEESGEQEEDDEDDEDEEPAANGGSFVAALTTTTASPKKKKAKHT